MKPILHEVSVELPIIIEEKQEEDWLEENSSPTSRMKLLSIEYLNNDPVIENNRPLSSDKYFEQTKHMDLDESSCAITENAPLVFMDN